MTTVTRRSKSMPRAIRASVATVLTWAIIVVFITPFLWTVITSFKTEYEAVKSPPSLVFIPTLANYADIFAGELGGYLWNSTIVTLATTAVVIAVGFPLAYALAVRPIRGGRDLLFFLIATRMMPVAGIIVPLYMLARTTGFLDSHLTLIVLYAGMNLPIAVWLLRAYLKEVPVEALEASRLDGANTWIELTRIALPMTLPSVAATAVLCGIFTWNEFFIGLSLTSFNAATVPVYLASFQSGRGLFIASLAAITVIAAIPPIIAGWFAQRRLVQGFALSTQG